MEFVWKGGAAMAEKEYLLGNRAMELYRYTKQAVKPVPDDKITAKDVSSMMRTIAQAKTVQEMQNLLLSTANRLEKPHTRKRFPKSETFDLIAQLRSATQKILRGVHAANETNFNEHSAERLNEIKVVIDECSLMLKLVELSHDFQYIDTKRMGIWTKKILDVKYMCLAWLKKDGARAKIIQNQREKQEMERLISLVREITASQ